MGTPRPSRITPEVLEKEAEVLRYRRAGLTFDLIAQRLEYADASGAHRAYVRACNRIVTPEVEEIRREEQERLDLAQAAIWPAVLRGEIPSVGALVRIMERRARLLGLDMPARIQQEITTFEGGTDIDREVQRLVALLAADSSSKEPMAESFGETGATAADE